MPPENVEPLVQAPPPAPPPALGATAKPGAATVSSELVSASPAGPALAWLVEEVRACNAAVVSATAQMGELAQRMAVLEAVERDMGSPIEDSEDLRRRLSWLAGEIQARGDVLTRAADEVDRVGSEMSTMRSQSNDQLANIQARVRQLEVAQGPVGLRHELDRVAAEVTGVPDFAELGRAALRTMELDGAVAALRHDIERITKGLGGLQQSAMAHVAGRTAPLEGAIHELRQEIATMAEDIAATRAEGDTELAESIEVLSERVVTVEMLSADIDGVRLAVDGLRARFAQSSEESAESSRERFDEVETRLAALAALNADVEGLYRELDRSAERIGTFESAMQVLVERSAPTETGVEDLRQKFGVLQEQVLPGQQLVVADLGERVQLLADRIGALGAMAAEVSDLQVTLGSVGEEASAAHQAALAAATEQLAIAARLRELDAVPVEIESIYRELDRVTGETVSIRETVLDAVLERIAPVERGVEQLRLDLDAVAEAAATQLGEVGRRVGSLEPTMFQVVGDIERISNATRDALGGVETDMEGVHRELDRVNAQAQRVDALEPVVEQLHAELASVSAHAQRVDALEPVVEQLQGELDRVNAQAQRVDALEPVVEQVRGDFDRVAEAMQGAVSRIESDFEGVHRELDRVTVEAERIRESILDEVTGRVAPVTAEVERVAVTTQAGLAELQARVGELASLEPRVAQAAGDIERVSLAARDALVGVEADMEGVHRELDRVSAQAEGMREALGDEVEVKLTPVSAEMERVAIAARDGLATLQSRIIDLASLPGQVSALTGDIEGIYHEVAQLSGAVESVQSGVGPQVTQEIAAVSARLESLAGMASELDRARQAGQATADQVDSLVATGAAIRTALGDLRADIERIDGSVAADRSMFNAKLVELETLPSEVSTLYREIGRLEDATSVQERNLAPVLGVVTELQDTVRALSARLGSLSDDALRSRIHEVTDPTEELVAQMAARVEAVMSELKAARSEAAAILGQSTPLTESIDALRADVERLRALEAVPGQMQDVAREVDTAVRGMGDRQEAELAAASAAVQALETRLAAIEAIPADMDGLYSALYGVAASLKDLGAEVPDSMPVAPKLVGTRRVPTRKPRSGQ